MMLAALLVPLLVLKRTSACPPNITAPTNCTRTAPEPACHTAYASSLVMLHSLRPNTSVEPSRFFMLRRQTPNDMQVAMQVQFSGLPKGAYACHLNLAIPSPDFATIHGPNPVFDVYAVEPEVDIPPTWTTYRGNGTNLTVVGTVSGEKKALKEARRSGTVTVGSVKCNHTLTFQMGLKYDAGDDVNYWGFVDVSPAAVPSQGWRIVYFCT